MRRETINISAVMAVQRLGIKERDDGIWLVSFMAYDLWAALLGGPTWLLVRRWSAVHWNEAFWRGRPVVESTVRPQHQEMSAPLLDDDARLPQRVEDLTVDQGYGAPAP